MRQGGSGIFTGTGGPITTIADTSGTLKTLGIPSINNAGAVAFRADLNGTGQAIFVGNGLKLTTIADTSGPFKSFGDGPSVNNCGAVAFLADLNAGGRGIFTGPDPAANDVIATGESLLGSTVMDLGFFRQGLNDAGQVAFWAKLADGREVIALATPRSRPIPAVITYPGSNGLLHEHVFLRGSDGNLSIDYYDGRVWTWEKLGNPGVGLSGNPAAIAYPASDGVLYEHVFVRGSDGQLYYDSYDGNSWNWLKSGNGGAPLNGSPAVISYPGSDSVPHENVFVRGSDGNLYLDSYDGTSWTWVNLGNGGVPLNGSPAVINYSGADGGLYENVFLLGSDGNLYLDAYSGGAWTWVNLGNGGAPLSESLVVINYPWSDGVLHEHVFLRGSDGNLYIDYYDGLVWTWANLGNPGVALSGSPAAIAYPASDGVLYEHVFARGSDGQLYYDSYDSSGWNWVQLGDGGVPLNGSPAVVNYPGSDGVLHENVFLLGSDANLYSDGYDGNSWIWVNLGSPGPG